MCREVSAGCPKALEGWSWSVSCPAELKENERGNCYETLEVWAAPDALLNNELLPTLAIAIYGIYTQNSLLGR